ncbi:MAG: phasin family protein [Geminicoccaceae bacterium]
MARGDTKAGAEANPPFVMPMMDISEFMNANQKGFKAAVEAQSHLLGRMAAVQSELFKFLNRRLNEDQEAARELAACKSATDAYTICSKFFETAAQQYSDEMGRLAGMYSDLARETMEDVQHQVEETADAMNNGAKLT